MLEPESNTIHPGTGGTNLSGFKARMTVFTLLLTLSSIARSFDEPVVDSISVSGTVPVSISGFLHGTGLGKGTSLLRVTPSEVRSGIVFNLEEMGYLEGNDNL